MKQPNRIIQLNKEIRANAATIVIAAVLLYVVISVVSSLSKESVTIYQVSKGDVSNDITLQGLAIRDEVIVNTQKSGYNRRTISRIERNEADPSAEFMLRINS